LTKLTIIGLEGIVSGVTLQRLSDIDQGLKRPP
jgi:hypothetical protein